MSENCADVRVKLSSGETYIAATQRSDGTWRKPRKVKTGYIPQEEQPKFESRAQQMMRQANSTLKFPVGYCPTKMQKKQELKMPPPPTTATLIDLNSSKPVAAIYKPNASITPQDHINKKINTLKKKLNEIKNLKKKIDNGEIAKVEQTQLEKINRQSTIESEIDKLVNELEKL